MPKNRSKDTAYSRSSLPRSRSADASRNWASEDRGASQTLYMLLACFNGSPLVPVDVICREYFAPLTLAVFLRKIGEGKIPLPLTRMSDSQKSAKMVHLRDLAEYIDQRREEGREEVRKLAS